MPRGSHDHDDQYPTLEQFEALRVRVSRLAEPHAHEQYALTGHAHPDQPGPGLWVPPDITRGGLVIGLDSNIEDALDLEDGIATSLHTYGRRSDPLVTPNMWLEQFKGRQCVVFDLPAGDPGDDHKIGGGFRSELHFGSNGAVMAGYNEVIRIGRIVYYGNDTLVPPTLTGLNGASGWNTFLQLHSTSRYPQHSPMFGIRNFHDGQYLFGRENEFGRVRRIGPWITVPLETFLYEEMTVFLRPDDQGYAQLHVWNMETHEEVTTAEHLYTGPTQILRDGKDYVDASRVTTYLNEGIYHRNSESSTKYRLFDSIIAVGR